MTIDIIGAGLAGSEAALTLAGLGFPVRLYDIKPLQHSPAHHSPQFAEIVCSNSLGSQGNTTASGLLKLELEQLGCHLLQVAESVSVPAGKALAVDRERFSARVTDLLMAHPLIEVNAEEVHQRATDADFTLFATGPLTTAPLVEHFGNLLKRKQLYFFDAAAPILTKESVNFEIAFFQDRYGIEQGSSEANYINCPLEKSHYLALIDFILSAERIELKDFEKESFQESTKAAYFESCLPIEVLASRGLHTLRYGPMKPVGLVDPRTGKAPYAAVQLRQDNAEGTLYNMVGFQTNLKWGAQKEMLQLIPGLEAAEVVRYGVMHRNTYIHSPEVLLPTLQLKQANNIFFAGQLTGTEGYTEAIASGHIAARNIAKLIQGERLTPLPKETMLGALLHYITREEAIGKSFQPINSNWGILPELSPRPKDKASRTEAYVNRAQVSLTNYLQHPSPALV